MKAIALLRGVLLAVVLVAGLGWFTGCETMEGAGKDIEHGGEKIQDVADDAKD